MSATTKRSDALKKLLATSIQTASDTPSDLTVFGAGKPPDQDSGVATPESYLEVAEQSEASSIVGSASTEGAVEIAEVAPDEPVVPDSPPLLRVPLPAPALFLSQRSAAKPTGWAKLSITLEPGDLEILDRFHASARDAGVKLRRGGNPSLFVRAALRAFEELSETRPEAWAERLAGVIAREV